MLNLHDRTALPGFSDSHIHLLNFGMSLGTLNFSRTRSIQEMKRRVAERASSQQAERWVLGRGWDDEKLREHRYPDKNDLDIVPTPVFLKRVCGHVAVANSKALAIAGISNRTHVPNGGIIQLDLGRPNGVLKERAVELVERVIPQFEDEIENSLILAAKRLIRLGITSLHCVINDAKEFSALRRLKRNRQIPQRIYAIIPVKLFNQLSALGLSTEAGADGFRIGGLKLFLDGSLGARTASLRAPYSDDPASRGILTMRKKEVLEIAHQAKEAGFQLCLHAIGDRAVELAIRVIEESLGDDQTNTPRHRIEHSSLISPDLIEKMGRVRIIGSIQPRFIYSDSWAVERLGAKRLKFLYPFRSMNRAGVLLAAGSDCPVEDPNPFEGLWSATVRPGLDPGERLTVGETLAAYSENAAYASFCDDSHGTLEVGKAADLIVVDRDPFDVGPDSLRKTKVLKTIIGGRIFV